MGKIKKSSSGSKNTAGMSAFAAYSTELHSVKRVRESSTSSMNDLSKTAEKDCKTPSLMKQISNKTGFSLMRAASKRNKNRKKIPEGPSYWQPATRPETHWKKSPFANYSSNTMPLHFKGSNNHKTVHPIGSKVGFIREKEDRSIELSTSQSLCEEEIHNNNLIPKEMKIPGVEIKNKLTAVEGLIIRDTNINNNAMKPPSKKMCIKEITAPVKLNKSNTEDGMLLHASGHKDNEKQNNLSQSISKKSSTLKMPFPLGDSEKDGKALTEWLLNPFSLDNFFNVIWEKKPLFVRRHFKNYGDGLFSRAELNRILLECNIQYSVNLDLTSYHENKRETHNLEGRAFAPVVWDYYKNGCSVRLINPQAFSKPIWRLCSTLQEYFKCVVGANIYLTPPGTQGFAPHYDDIEAFVFQLEGKKHWSLYSPITDAETLPRTSSRNFDPSEIGSPLHTTILEPGDLLYFPRGTIHQAKSLPDVHSLHITISMYQKNCWGDLFEVMMQNTLQRAITENIEFRAGLPFDYLSVFGVQNTDRNPKRRKEMKQKVRSLFLKMADYCDLDEAVDERATQFLHDSLPPVFTQGEKSCTIYGTDIEMAPNGEPGACLCGIDVDTKVRVLRKNAVRLVPFCDGGENRTMRVYHNLQNPRVYHAEERKFFELELHCGPALEHLIHAYPKFVGVGELPLDSEDDKVNLVSFLYERGILATEKKIEMIDTSADQ